jgi:putative ABC transport system permease protein
MILQSLKMAWKSIISNKMRSFLTMLGIIIGVMALVVLVSLVSGTTDSVNDQIASIATNQITVTINDNNGTPIKLDDLDTFATDEEITAVAPVAQASFTIESGQTSETAFVYGTTASYADIQGLTLSNGRFLKGVDVSNHTNVAVISPDIATDILGRTNVVGDTLRINGSSFLIIGVLEDDDTTTSSDSVYEIYIPYTALIRQSDSVSTSITSFCLSAASEDTLDLAENAIENLLLAHFNNNEDCYTIINQSTIMETMENVNNMLALLLGGIAAISLLVGGIGIMNIMLVSVTERTREIGIRKAIGASRGTIMLQFLIEALMVSLMGCTIGILLSWITLRILSVIGTAYSLNFQLSMGVVWISILFSLGIGVIFGLYPANKAASKNPIEALRYMG